MLLFLVLVLWGAIGYQITATLNPKEPKQLVDNTSISFIPKQHSIDTFSVSKVNRDPFLGKLTSSTTKRKHSKKSILVPKILEQTLNIVYLGMIQKKNAKQQIFIIAIDGTQHLFKIKQEFEEVKLLSGTTKAITIRIAGKSKTIKVQ